jgi:hypothetical protein
MRLRLTDIARPDSVCVRDGLAGWGGRIRTSASPNRNSPRLSALRRQDSNLCIPESGIRQDSQPRRRDSNLRIWESDPLHSLSHKRGFDAVRWSHANKVSPATFHRDAQVRIRKEVHAGRITLARAAEPPANQSEVRMANSDSEMRKAARSGDPAQLPARAARQLPDQSTTLRVESSSTGNPRLRGALP